MGCELYSPSSAEVAYTSASLQVLHSSAEAAYTSASLQVLQLMM